MQKDKWEHCPYCGSRTITIDAKTLRRQCEICYRTFYPESYPALSKDVTRTIAVQAVAGWPSMLN